jgi:hydroxypyruvate isomerase
VTRFGVNIGFLYRELPFEARFRAARDAGFEAIESAWPADPTAFAAATRAAGLRVALLNVAAGDLDKGERGYPNDPRAVARWRADFGAALRLADAVGCPTLNVLAGNEVPGAPVATQWSTLRENLAWALPLAAAEGRRLVVELLNPHDNPTYLVTDSDAARELIEPFATAGLRLQLDTYHVARIGLDVTDAYVAFAPLVAHIQIADVPGRHEPGSGSIDWPAFFAALDGHGYDGAVGLEYRPAASTPEGLAWLPPDARPWSAQPFLPGRS